MFALGTVLADRSWGALGQRETRSRSAAEKVAWLVSSRVEAPSTGPLAEGF